MKVATLIVTFFYVGNLRPAAGTWGSLTALPAAWALHVLGGPVLLAAGIIVAAVLGVWATGVYTGAGGNHDPSEVVIDEVAGQWIAVLPLSVGALHADVSITALWPGWIVAFVLFRLLDITKLGPIGWADRRNDAFGVMLDDLFAGVAAAVGVLIFGWAYHG